MIKSNFQTVAYKQGYIFINQWQSDITGKSGETVKYCPCDGLGSFECKSIHAAKIKITKFNK